MSKRSYSFTLPWPPSVNHYKTNRVLLPKTGEIIARIHREGPAAAIAWLRKHARTQWYLQQRGKDYLNEVRSIVGVMSESQTLFTPAMVDVTMFPPDRRRRDADNLFKMILDALEYARVVNDDSQFKCGSWRVIDELADQGDRRGRVEVVVEEL